MQRQLGAGEGIASVVKHANRIEAVQEEKAAGLLGQRVGRVCGQVDGNRAERRQDPARMGDGPLKAIWRNDMCDDGYVGRARLRPIAHARCSDVGDAVPKQGAQQFQRVRADEADPALRAWVGNRQQCGFGGAELVRISVVLRHRRWRLDNMNGVLKQGKAPAREQASRNKPDRPNGWARACDLPTVGVRPLRLA